MSERQTVAMQPGAFTYEHNVIIPLGLRRLESAHPTDRPLIAVCRTRKPATRCECGMYDLEWLKARGE